jgi:hypothetical protein
MRDERGFAMIDVRSLPGAKVVEIVRQGGYFPVLAVLPDGSLVAVLRMGAGHVGLEGRLDCVRSLDGGYTWTEPQVLVNSAWDDRNPALGVAAEGTLVLAYHVQRNYDEKGRYSRLGGH